MKKNDNEEKLIELLKNLPRENAPENFEFNLMTRIKNKNFGDLQKEERTGLMWIFLPSATIVTAAVAVLVFMFSSVDNTNAVAQLPAKINHTEAKTYVVIREKESKGQPDNEIEALKIVKAPNDVVIKEKIKIPVNGSAGISIDSYLNKSVGGENSAATLVSSEEKAPLNFREFLPLPQRTTKAKKDSLKKEPNR